MQEVVAKSGKLRTVGTAHCFNEIADSNHHQVSLQHLRSIVGIDYEAATITVEAGARYGDICQFIHNQGFALQNLASLPHISIAGACATATHGSGVRNPNLAASVISLEMVKANSEVVTLSRRKDGDRFFGMVVNLGGLGVVSKLTLQLKPTYNIAQHVYQNLPINECLENFHTIMESGYSVSMFTDWQGDAINQVWIKSKNSDSIHAETNFFGAKLAEENLHPDSRSAADTCTKQLSIPGPWYEHLPHFKVGAVPASGSELQTEYFIPTEHAVAAIEDIHSIGNLLEPVIVTTELRTVAADDFWMSTCYQRDSTAIHFSWNLDPEGVQKVLPSVEKALEPFEPRPHWGKISSIPTERVQALYPKINEFRWLLEEFDPSAKFRNAYLEKAIF